MKALNNSEVSHVSGAGYGGKANIVEFMVEAQRLGFDPILSTTNFRKDFTNWCKENRMDPVQSMKSLGWGYR